MATNIQLASPGKTLTVADVNAIAIADASS
jgi:hypothetical protein